MKLPVLAVAVLIAAAPAVAQSTGLPPRGEVGIRIGVFEPRADSDVWETNGRYLTRDSSDFDGVMGGVSFASHLNRFLDFQVATEYYDERVDSNFRGFPAVVEQNERLRLLPIDFSLKFYPIPRTGGGGPRDLHIIVPYVGGGAGVMGWEFRQGGDFLFATLDPNVFNVGSDERESRGFTTSWNAYAGFEIQFTPEFSISIEGRRRWAEDDLGSDFSSAPGNGRILPPGADRIDLTGTSLSASFNIRF